MKTDRECTVVNIWTSMAQTSTSNLHISMVRLRIARESSDLVRRERHKFHQTHDIKRQGYTLVRKEQEHRPIAFGGPKTHHFFIERENGVIEKECYRENDT